jgi:hypothetical protein
MRAYILLREPGQTMSILRQWWPAPAVELAGCLAPVGSIIAFTPRNAAYVRAVGQSALLFTFIASVV